MGRGIGQIAGQPHGVARGPYVLGLKGFWGNRFGRSIRFLIGAALVAVPGVGRLSAEPTDRVGLDVPVVLVQLPLGSDAERGGARSSGMRRADYGASGRLVRLDPDGTLSLLSRGFDSAADPDVACDATRVLFAGKRAAADCWDVFELTLADGSIRQVTHGLGDCRSPHYESTFFTITASEPWEQIGFVSTRGGAADEFGGAAATHLYTCKLDGSFVQQITYNLSSDVDPAVLPDGRLLYASWHRATLDDGLLGRIAIEGINVDGSDRAAFVPRGRRIQHMPCVTPAGLSVFVEADQLPWDGAGVLAGVTLRRPLHSYRPITGPADGLFHSPAPLPDGQVLVAWRPADGSGSHGLYRLDPATGRRDVVFDDPAYHEIQPRAVVARTRPDGRSSVVSENDPRAELYCLNVYATDLPEPKALRPGSVRALRVIEGLPVSAEVSRSGKSESPGSRALAPRRILAEVPVAADGSFHITVPASTPLQLQILDEQGLALRTCGWIWARNHQAQGCIGCHEDPERTPDNRGPDALRQPALSAIVPVEARLAVDFDRDLVPRIATRCAPCHAAGGSRPWLAGDGVNTGAASSQRLFEALTGVENGSRGPAVDPGRARTSRVIWHMLGHNTARPWDGAIERQPAAPLAPGAVEPLSNAELEAFIRWIDLGAPRSAPAACPPAAPEAPIGGPE